MTVVASVIGYVQAIHGREKYQFDYISFDEKYDCLAVGGRTDL